MAVIPVKGSVERYFEVDNIQAHTIQKDFISKWEPKREVWTLNYGHDVIAVAAGISGFVINSMFRKKLRLLHHGVVFTSFFLSIGPGAIAAMSHEHFITRSIMLYETHCPACQGAKAIFSLNTHGVFYPLIVSPAISLAIAGSIGYRIPQIYEIKEIARFWWSVVRPQSSKIAYLLFANSMLASILVYKQLTSMEIVTKILLQVEERANDEQELANK